MMSSPLKLLSASLLIVGITSVGLTAPPTATPVGADLSGDPLPDRALARLGTTRWRQVGAVRFVAFIEKGKQLLTVGEDGISRVWDVETGKELRHFGKAEPKVEPNRVARGPQRVNAVEASLSADGALLATGRSNEGLIRLWDVATGKERDTINTGQKGIGSLRLHPEGKSLFVGTDLPGPTELDVATGKKLRSFGKPIPDDPQLQALALLRRFNGGNEIALSPDGGTLAGFVFEMEDKALHMFLKVWDLGTGKELVSIEEPALLNSIILAFAPDGKTLARSDSTGASTVIEIATQKATRLAEGRGSPVTGLVFTSDGKALAVKRADQSIQLLDAENGKEVRRYSEPINPGRVGMVSALVRNSTMPRELALAPDGQTIVAVGSLNTIRLWDVESGRERQPFNGHQGIVTAAIIAADGKSATTHGTDNTVRQWELSSGKELARFKLADGTFAAVFSPDGRSVAVAQSDNTIGVYDTATGKRQHQFARTAISLAFSPDGKILASKNTEPLVRLWDLATDKELPALKEEKANDPTPLGVVVTAPRTTPVVAAVAFTPDGTAVASLTNANPNAAIRGQSPALSATTVRLWHVGAGKLLARFEVPAHVKSFAFSPDGRALATATGDQIVSVREVSSGKERCQFKADADAVVFAADGRTLAAADTERSLHVWDLATAKELSRFSGHRGTVRALTFAADGRKLMSGSDDTSVLVWDAAGLQPGNPAPAAELDAMQVKAHWVELSDSDAARAYQAMWALSQAPAQSLPLLRERLKPAEGVDPKRMEQLILDLSNEKFTVRQQATTDLEKLGDLAVPALEKVLTGQPTLEIKQRVERLLEQLVEGQKAPPAATLQTIRAVETLQQMGTPEAQQLLEALARGTPGARLTREARKSLDLLAK